MIPASLPNLAQARTLLLLLLAASAAGAAAAPPPPKDVLPYAAARGHVALVNDLLREGVPADTPDSNGTTPLQHAAAAGHPSITACLLEHGAAPDRRDAAGWTALHHAFARNQHAVARILLQRGASPEIPVPGTNHTLLAQAAVASDLAALDILLSAGASPAALSHGRPPLSHAAANGHVSAAQLLLDSRAAVDQRNPHNNTALMAAASNGCANVTSLLLSRGAAADVWNTAGQTALMLAAEQGHTPVVRLLLACNAQVDIQNPAGRTAQHLAPPNSTALALLLQPEAVCEDATLGQLGQLAMLARRRGQALRRLAASTSTPPKLLGWNCLERRLYTWLLSLRRPACGILGMVALVAAGKLGMRLFGRWRDLQARLAQLQSTNTQLHATVETLNGHTAKLMSSNAELNAKVEELKAQAAQPAAPAARTEDCPICYAAEATVVFRPCKHLAMCAACAARMNPRRCPVCRTRADRLSSVYRP